MIKDWILGQSKMLRGVSGVEWYMASKTFRNTQRIIANPSGTLEDRLNVILRHSIENVPFYRENYSALLRFKDPMEIYERMDYIDKTIVMNHHEQLHADYKGMRYRATTGGTTGKPLIIDYPLRSFWEELAFINSMWKSFGVKRSKVKLTLRGKVYGGNTLYWFNPVYNELRVNPTKLTKENLKTLRHLIQFYRPEVLYGHYSSVVEFISLFENSTELDWIKFVLLGSEGSSVEQRRSLSVKLNAKVCTWYGHSERLILAPFEGNGYVTDPKYGYADLLVKQDNTAELVGTTFYNHFFPLIKYRTNDFVNGYKTYDNGKHIFTSLQGRWDNKVLIGRNGEKISLAYLNFHGEELRGIYNHQFIQYEKGKADIVIVSSDHEFDSSNLHRILKAKVPESIIQFSIIQEVSLRKTSRGKVLFLISEL